MQIEEITEQIEDEFSQFEDWMDKYSYLIDMGKDLEPMAEEFKTKQNLISGCQSRVWVKAEYKRWLD